MKIKCKQSNLLKALSVVAHIAGKNVSLPILNNILIKAKDKIVLGSTNLDIGIKTQMRGSVENQGEITVPAKLFYDYVSFLTDDELEFYIDSGNLIIQSKNQKTKIKTQAADEYPIIPEVEKGEEINLVSADIKKALSKVLYSASYDDIRPELSGILFNLENRNLTLAATDSYRLAEFKTELTKVEKQTQIKKIIPLKTLQELTRLIPDEKTDIKVYFSQNQVMFRVGEVEMISRLVDGEYPDYKEIIPSGYKTKAIINKKELEKVIKSTSLFTKSGINDVSLYFSQKGKSLKVSASNTQLGESNSELSLERIEGEDGSVVFNYKYLLDGLQNIEKGEVGFELNGSDNPVVLKPLEDKSYLYLVMPIRK